MRPRVGAGVAVIVATQAVLACGATSPTPTPPPSGASFSLTVQNQAPAGVSVMPWEGAAATAVACGQSASFTPGSGGAPPLPWTVTVTGAQGNTLLKKTLPPGTGAKQIFVTAQGAELADAGGSHGAPGSC